MQPATRGATLSDFEDVREDLVRYILLGLLVVAIPAYLQYTWDPAASLEGANTEHAP